MMATRENDVLQKWYGELDDEVAYSRRCQLFVPEGIAGARALDVNCRNGKGAYKLAEAVGEDGFVLGTCVSAEQLAKARAGMAKALQRAGLAKENLAFAQAFPEDLGAVAADGAFDVVYVNNSLNVAFDPIAVLKEACRVLAPGGRLVLATVCADGPRSVEVRVAARKLGNVVQAAPQLEHLLAQLGALGFENAKVLDRRPIEPTAGVLADTVVDVVASEENVTFSDVIILAEKAGA